MAAARNVIVPVLIGWIVVGITLTIRALEVWGSHTWSAASFSGWHLRFSLTQGRATCKAGVVVDL
jgi:hypothetical protein